MNGGCHSAGYVLIGDDQTEGGRCPEQAEDEHRSPVFPADAECLAQHNAENDQGK